jgi:hypothetical protein
LVDGTAAVEFGHPRFDVEYSVAGDGVESADTQVEPVDGEELAAADADAVGAVLALGKDALPSAGRDFRGCHQPGGCAT